MRTHVIHHYLGNLAYIPSHINMWFKLSDYLIAKFTYKNSGGLIARRGIPAVIEAGSVTIRFEGGGDFSLVNPGYPMNGRFRETRFSYRLTGLDPKQSSRSLSARFPKKASRTFGSPLAAGRIHPTRRLRPRATDADRHLPCSQPRVGARKASEQDLRSSQLQRESGCPLKRQNANP